MGNIERLMKVNTILVPILIASILLLMVKNINAFEKIQYEVSNVSLMQVIFSAIIYTSYNSIVLVLILIPLAKKIQNKKYIIISIICTIIFIILAIAIYGLLLKIDININNIELPTVYVAGMIGKKYQILYGIIILVSIYTSAISAGYGFLEKYKNNKTTYKKIAICMCLCAFLVANIGFSKLLNLLYPIFGILGMFQIIFIIIKKDTKHLEKNNKN
jgi:uncharacterized membrane protein YkvI